MLVCNKKIELNSLHYRYSIINNTISTTIMSTTIGTDSYPFVPGQCMLTFVNGIPIVNDESNNDLLSDLSYQIVFKLHETTETNNL